MRPVQMQLQYIKDLSHRGAVMLDFEATLEGYYRRLVVPGATVIDIGAHTGRHLIPLMECVGSSGTVIGFEPLPVAFETLKNRTPENGVVRLINAALSNYTGTAEFVFAQGCPEESGLRERTYNVPEIAEPTTIQVHVDTLDSFCKDLTRLDFIKIDIEGGEIDCLKGAQDTIARLRPVISVEYGSPAYSAYGHSKETLFDLADSCGYVLYDIFLNCLKEREDWRAACDTIYWDYIMVPLEKEAAFNARMVQPRPALVDRQRELVAAQEAIHQLQESLGHLQARAKTLEEQALVFTTRLAAETERAKTLEEQSLVSTARLAAETERAKTLEEQALISTTRLAAETKRAKTLEEQALISTTRLAAETERANALEGRNVALLNSTSWRATAPLRALSRIFR